MKYQPPVNSNTPDESYKDGTESVQGSIVPAKAIEYPQREIVNVIKSAGISPSDTSTSQLVNAIRSISISYDSTIDYNNPVIVLASDGYLYIWKQRNGPLSTIVDPVNDTNHQYWAPLIDFIDKHILSSNYVTITDELAAEQEISVPDYTVGTNTLQVFIDGALAVSGVHYYEIGNAGELSNKIKFSSAIPAGSDLFVTSAAISTINTATVATTTRSETLLTTPIEAETIVTVPSYYVGTAQLNVFINGIRCHRGDTYSEVGVNGSKSTNIKFNDSIPSGYDVEVVIS